MDRTFWIATAQISTILAADVIVWMSGALSSAGAVAGTIILLGFAIHGVVK